MVALCALLFIISFIMLPKIAIAGVNSDRRVAQDETFFDKKYNVTLVLFPNGKCVMRGENKNERISGEYDIDEDDKITFVWEGYNKSEKGFIEWKGFRIKRVVYREYIFINEDKIVIPSKVIENENLYNKETQKTLTLYRNGMCKINTLIPKEGSYYIDDDNKITLEWENYQREKGLVEWVATTSGARVKKVVFQEQTFINEERFVIPR